MIMSEIKQLELYDAISGSIMDERIAIRKLKSIDKDAIDAALFQLQHDIWKKVLVVLNIKEAS